MACWTGQSHTSLLEGEFHPGRFQRVSGYRRRRAPCFQCCLNISASLSWGWVCYRLYQSVCEDQNHAAAESVSSSSSLGTCPTHQHAEQTRSALQEGGQMHGNIVAKGGSTSGAHHVNHSRHVKDLDRDITSSGTR